MVNGDWLAPGSELLTPGSELLTLGMSCLVRVFVHLGPHGISLTSTWAEDPVSHTGSAMPLGPASNKSTGGPSVPVGLTPGTRPRTTGGISSPRDPLETTDTVPGLPDPAPRASSFG